MCKLSLGGQLMSDQNELFVKLKCSILSSEPVLEVIWLRNNKQITPPSEQAAWTDSLPKGVAEEPKGAGAGGQLVEEWLFPVQVVNSRQEFMLTDLMSQNEGATFKCIGRNSRGYSEACELGQLDKSILLSEYNYNCILFLVLLYFLLF